MDQSILISIKKLLGINETDTNFDIDIIIHINSVLSILNQLGVGPTYGFAIENSTAKWSDFLGTGINIAKFNFIQSYVYMKVKLIFDPPLSSSVLDAFKKNIDEFEWRANNTSKEESVVI